MQSSLPPNVFIINYYMDHHSNESNSCNNLNFDDYIQNCHFRFSQRGFLFNALKKIQGILLLGSGQAPG
jgi:hypothetical protein